MVFILVLIFMSAAPLVWLYIVKNEILQESQKTNSARYGPILPIFSPVSHSFMLNGPNSNFKLMGPAQQPSEPQKRPEIDRI